MNQTISGPQFAGLFWRDAFDFFVASDKVTAICVANLMGDEGDIVVGKSSMFSAALILVVVMYSLQVI